MDKQILINHLNKVLAAAVARGGLSNHGAIAASKAGIIGLTIFVAMTYARYGVRVNCIAPGLIRTPLTEHITSITTAEQGAQSMHALGRLGEYQDVASAITWLLVPKQSWVTGQVLGVDRGLGSLRPQVKGCYYG